MVVVYNSIPPLKYYYFFTTFIGNSKEIKT